MTSQLYNTQSQTLNQYLKKHRREIIEEGAQESKRQKVEDIDLKQYAKIIQATFPLKHQIHPAPHQSQVQNQTSKYSTKPHFSLVSPAVQSNPQHGLPTVPILLYNLSAKK